MSRALSTRKNAVMAWHFSGPELRDGRPLPAIGETLKHDGRLVICESGLHASIDPFDALQYAPGGLLHRVECGGVSEHTDKIVCRERTIIASIDATTLLRRFACDQAIEALRITATTPPQIVADYLRTADESMRDAARGAAWDAAWGSARGAARGAARDAARGAARGAAWDAARDAAWGAARGAAWGAARDAARDAAWDAAWGAARDAARDAARNDFSARVYSAFGLESSQ